MGAAEVSGVSGYLHTLEVIAQTNSLNPQRPAPAFFMLKTKERHAAP